jgi:hypothetical protein
LPGFALGEINPSKVLAFGLAGMGLILLAVLLVFWRHWLAILALALSMSFMTATDHYRLKPLEVAIASLCIQQAQSDVQR